MRSRTQNILGWLTYPVMMSAAVVVPAMIINPGIAPSSAVLCVVLAIAGVIAILEYINPANTARRPRWDDWCTDSLFMFTVQLILPKVVTFLFAVSLVQSAAAHEPLRDFWPDHWPDSVQVLLMLLTADFGRYWLHRASHARPMLWPLHAVHHSPRLLYWANVGRFHPLDKVLQMAVDTLPFLWLGVNESVLAAYFAIYATNGFLQHSNIYLRHGFLNYIFSTAELHRWHHARHPQIAHCNFGNNLIIWDLLFGTWFLPPRKAAPAPGIRLTMYPMDFLGQLLIPFRKQRLDTPKLRQSTEEKSL